MTARRLDGGALARQLRQEVAREVSVLLEAGRRPPGLSVLLVGDDPASEVYVGKKEDASREVGMASRIIRKPGSTSEKEVLAAVDELNGDPAVDGILVQLPLPQGVDTQKVLERVDPAKDVDGFHPVNAGKLAQGKPGLAPCTPSGIIELLKREEIPLEGASAVVLGRSVIVGRPMALLLINESATVTVAHSRTRDLPALCRQADILVAAVGRPGLVTDAFVKPGAVVIDVGINRITDAALAEDLLGADSRRFARFKEKGSSLVGDIHPRLVNEVAGALTPVPGGVGPLTVAMLLSNTLAAYRTRG